MNKHLLLNMSVKRENETLGPDGTGRSALVFGELPTLKTILGPLQPRPALTERAKVIRKSKKLMTHELTAAKIKQLMKHKTPSATVHTYSPGDFVLVWREKIKNS